MNKLRWVPIAGAVMMAAGCAQMTMHKLQSSDETQWREGLQEVQKDDVILLSSQEFSSGPERLAKVAMNKGLGHYSEDVEYPMPVRISAVKMLGELLDSTATYKRPNPSGSNGNQWSGFYDECSVSENAFESLFKVHGNVSEEEIKKEIVRIFDNAKGYCRLLSWHNGYDHFGSGACLSTARKIFSNCADAKWPIAFDFFVPYAQVKDLPDSTETLLDIKKHVNEGGSSKKLAHLEKEANSREYNRKMQQRARYALTEIYLNIQEPSLEQSKQALILCNKSIRGIKPGPNGFIFTDPHDYKESYEYNEPSVAQEKAVKRIPEETLRVLLSELRESNPETYWFVWGHCATPEEALKVYNSKTSTEKRKIAIARLGNESMLKEIATGKDEELVIAAIQAMFDTKSLAQFADNKALPEKFRLAAIGRLCNEDLIRHNGNVDTDALWASISSFDYTEDFPKVYSTTIKSLSKVDAQNQAVQKIRDLMKVRVDRIIADGETVKDETFCCKGFRLGMYKWEFELLKAYYDVVEIDNTEYIGYTFHGHDGGDYVSYLVFKGAAIKKVFGYDSSWSRSVLNDHFTDDFGDGGKSWNFEIMGDENCRIIRVENASKTLPPRFKGRASTGEESAMNHKEAIRKACEVKGEIQLFFLAQNEIVPKPGDVYCYRIPSSKWWSQDINCCNSSAVVKQIVDGGIVVGCVKEHQRVQTGQGAPKGYTSYNSVRPAPMVPIYKTFEFPNRIFIKTKKRYATGVPLSYDTDKYFKYIGMTSFTTKNGKTISLHSFEPFTMPKEIEE